MAIEQLFVDWLDKFGYHPRSSKHSDVLSELIIADLIEHCPLMAERAARGELVAKLRHHQQVGYNDWVIDIALGTCAGKAVPPDPAVDGRILMTAPSVIQVAIELKAILTEHGKARKNRLRDFEAFHGYAHQYHPRTIAAAFVAVNASELFYSPLRSEGDITRHGSSRASAREVARNAVDLFRAIHLRNSESDVPGMEAVGVIVIEHDNLNVHKDRAKVAPLHMRSRISPIPPSLPVGDPLHYQTMIQRICTSYSQRFR